MKHEGKVAIVTGASMSIGKAICNFLAEEGCDIVCAARSTALLEETAKEVRAKGRKALVVTMDVLDKASIKNMVEQTMAEFGKIDILINNAGGPLAGTGEAPVTTQDEYFDQMDAYTFVNVKEEKWNSIFNINFYGMLNCTKAVLPVMLEQEKGQILSVTSKAGKMKADVVPGMIAYACSKAALSRFTEVLAFELMCVGSEVKINAISPGMIRASAHSKLSEEDLEMFGHPEDIKESLLKILDPENEDSGEIYSAADCKTWYKEIQEGDD
jgi:NAD(P)-dependent dehydrogenase (short-subunit alcohol dehydrogenase family)